MRVGALICGVLGGLIALFIGIFGSALFALAGAGGWQSAWLYQAAAYGLPILAIAGGALALSNSGVASPCLALSAVGIVALFGFGGPSVLPVALIGVGALLAFLDSNRASVETKPSTPARGSGDKTEPRL